MQGHNDVLGFKAFICHDGILDTKNAFFGTEEIYFAVGDCFTHLATGYSLIRCLNRSTTWEEHHGRYHKHTKSGRRTTISETGRWARFLELYYKSKG